MKFDLLYIDFPFVYPKRDPTKKFGNGSTNSYTTTNDEYLINLKNYIEDITNNDTIICAWASPALDHRNNTILNEWGYSKVTRLYTWVKVDKNGKVRKLPGNYTSSSTEDVLLYRKCKKDKYNIPILDKYIGKAPKRYVNLQDQVVFAPLREHSRKPDIIRKMIVDLFGNELSKLEMFAREYKDSKYMDYYTLIGNEITGNDIVDDLIFLNRI